jgi:hypothetical protein
VIRRARRRDRLEELAVDLPDSLPAQLYLLTYDPERRRMAGRIASGYLGLALRAAALDDLRRQGRITEDERGRVVLGPERSQPVGGVTTLDDPVLARVLGQVEASRKPRSWAHWVGQDTRRTTRLVRDQLEAGRWLRVERDRLLGIFPRTVVTPRDPRLVRALRDDTRRALRGSASLDQAEPGPRRLAALAALGEIRVLVSRREAREHRVRIDRLRDGLGPLGPALRSAVRAQKAADAASSAVAGG